MTRQDHNIQAMTTIWLLPIVTLIVAAACGAVVSTALWKIDVGRTCLTLATSFVICVIGVCTALMVFVIYLQRLIIHGLPQGLLIFSSFLPLGPLGQSGFAFLTMGQVARQMFPLASAGGGETNIFTNELAPSVLYMFMWVLAFALWSLATAWTFLAFLALGDTLRKGFLPFKITFWGMIFPNVRIYPFAFLLLSLTPLQGVYANLTIQLGVSIDSGILKVWGSIYAIFTFSLWIFAMSRTLPSVWDGSIFEAPCIGEADMLANRGTRCSASMATSGTVTAISTGGAASEKEMAVGTAPVSATSSR